jgi:transposase
MKQYSEAFIGFDTAKKKHAVAIADVGRESEIRYLGEIDSAPAAIERMIRKLAGRYEKLHFCYEAGPTGYGLYRQVCALGHRCTVVAPSLIPKKSGERVKTNRRDGHCQLNLGRATRVARRMRDHAAATAYCHWFAASARKIRSAERETRWR